MTEVARGFCLLCGTTITEDVNDHFAAKHQQASPKLRVPIMSWRDRLDQVTQSIEELRQETDVDAQIRKLDVDVIQQLYLVRARLARAKGSPVTKLKNPVPVEEGS
jgi:hypothetical protein